MFDQPVSKLFLEKFEPHFTHEQNDLLCMHLRDCGHIVVNINFTLPCLKLVQHELDGAIQPGTDFVTVAQSAMQVTWKKFSKDELSFHCACENTPLPLTSSLIRWFSKTHFPDLKQSKTVVLKTIKDKPTRMFNPTDAHNDFHNTQWKELSELKEELQPVVLMLPMDSEVMIETHGNDLKNRSTKGELVSTSPGQVMAMSWKTWHRTAKPIGSHCTRRNRRLIVLLGNHHKFLTNTKVTHHGKDCIDHGR